MLAHSPHPLDSTGISTLLTMKEMKRNDTMASCKIHATLRMLRYASLMQNKTQGET
jgi:hypothetical protein